MTDLDRRALLIGAGVMLVVLVPPVVALRVALGGFSDDSNLWLVALAVFCLGSVAGGGTAASAAGRRHLVHGATAASGAFVAAVAVGLVRRSLTGDGILSVAMLVTVMFFTLFAASLGVLGGLLARRRALKGGATA